MLYLTAFIEPILGQYFLFLSQTLTFLKVYSFKVKGKLSVLDSVLKHIFYLSLLRNSEFISFVSS